MKMSHWGLSGYPSGECAIYLVFYDKLPQGKLDVVARKAIYRNNQF